MSLSLTPASPTAVWGDPITVTYGGAPEDFAASTTITGAVTLAGARVPVTTTVSFSAVCEAPVLAGYVFTQDQADPKRWVGQLA